MGLKAGGLVKGFLVSVSIVLLLCSFIATFENLVKADSTPPTFVTLLEAGNTDELAFGTDTTAHFYRNGTLQKENWIFIKAQITDDVTIDTVFCEWYNGSWANLTMSLVSGYYELNVTGQSYSACTFNIHANDTSNNWMTKYVWKFKDYQASWGTNEEYRKYIGLNQTASDISYKIYYVYNSTYTYEQDDDRALPHEQPTDGTTVDTGLLTNNVLTQVYQRNCTSFLGFFINDPICIDPTIISSTYLHIWWNTSVRENPVDKTYFGLKYEDADQMEGDTYTNYSTTAIKAKKVITGLTGVRYSTYNLEATYFDNTDITLSDNTVNLLALKLYAWGRNPAVLSSQNYSSFVIFNLPSNTTLQTIDSDSDGLTDFQELYIYFTDPFKIDTDGGGESDYAEVNNARDPLIPTDDVVTDVQAPSYSDVSTSTPPMENSPCDFRIKLSDNVAISSWIFSWNNGTAWYNSTATFPVSSYTFNATESDGYIYNHTDGVAYSVCRTAPTGTVTNTSDTFSIGQECDVLEYYIRRAFLFFTTFINQTPTSAFISLYYAGNYSAKSWNVTVQISPTWTAYPHDPLQTIDYNYNYYTLSGGTISINTLTSGYNSIILTYPSWISQGGTTKFTLRSSDDINNLAPADGDMDYIYFKSSENVTYPPQLTVYYNVQTVWGNTTRTLPAGGTLVQYRWYANDTSGNWLTTPTYSFTTTYSTVGWHDVEQWTLNLISPAILNWADVETWTLNLSTYKQWVAVENWLLTLRSLYYYDIEQWSIILNMPTAPMQPLLPITFILGMVGLVCLFVCPIYAIHKFKEKEYLAGFRTALILFAVGFGLFIGWLLMGVG